MTKKRIFVSCGQELEAATLDWCKVFGSDGPNPTHWKRISEFNLTEIQEAFQKSILSRTGFSQAEWKNYHEKMRQFRDRYVAHVEVGQIPPVPYYDKALQVAYAYDEWVRKLIKSDLVDGPTLEFLYDKWRREAASLPMRD